MTFGDNFADLAESFNGAVAAFASVRANYEMTRTVFSLADEEENKKDELYLKRGAKMALMGMII